MFFALNYGQPVCDNVDVVERPHARVLQACLEIAAILDTLDAPKSLFLVDLGLSDDPHAVAAAG